MIAELKSQKIIPDLDQFGIYDESSFTGLLKQVYIIAPSLFVGRSKEETSFICASFAGLLSSQDNSLIEIILSQLQDLTEDEKKDLKNILQRTSLSNVIKTIKEIDYRLNVISDLEEILFNFEKTTLEVDHLQQVLNVNTWVFGEQYRLFTDTEGALKKTLYDYAEQILKIENPSIVSKSRKELDLFLVKSSLESETEQRNVIIEIKRPSITLGKKEYLQIEEYADEIKNESICNGENIFWDFYLVGNNYDEYITGKIDEARNHGEKRKGLSSNQKDGHFKIYVRKWSDILQIELAHKMRYLKEKLKISSATGIHNNSSDIIIQKYKLN